MGPIFKIKAPVYDFCHVIKKLLTDKMVLSGLDIVQCRCFINIYLGDIKIMMVNFNHAKKVAAGCLAMSSCALFLWLNQTGIQADQVMTGQSVTTSQLASNQGTNNSTGGANPFPY